MDASFAALACWLADRTGGRLPRGRGIPTRVARPWWSCPPRPTVAPGRCPVPGQFRIRGVLITDTALQPRMAIFDAAAIQSLLEALDEHAARGTTADITWSVGRIALQLSDAARTTRDLDAVFAPTSQVHAADPECRHKFGLAEDWLNDAVKGFVPPGTDADQRVVSESAHLRVCVAGAEAPAGHEERRRPGGTGSPDLALLVDALGLVSAIRHCRSPGTAAGPSYPIRHVPCTLLDEIFEEKTTSATRVATPVACQSTSQSGARPAAAQPPEPRGEGSPGEPESALSWPLHGRRCGPFPPEPGWVWVSLGGTKAVGNTGSCSPEGRGPQASNP